jgi:hypothetical protein
MSSLVTIATDGFRNYVELPDGRQLNMGPVSVLKVVLAFVSSHTMCRQALDAFLKKGRTMIQADVETLKEMLKSPRARWAGNAFMGASPQGRGTVRMQGQVKIAALDAVGKRELDLYIENETRLNQQKRYVLKSLEQKFSRGRLDDRFAVSICLVLVGNGAKMYAREFGAVDDEVFSKETQVALAKDLADRYKSQIESGELDMRTASEEGVQGDSNDVAKHLKLASEEVPLVNEGLAHLVAAKVDDALATVEASEKKGTEVAKQDLHTISIKLASLVEDSNMADPTLRPSFVELAAKADKVKSYFSG